MSDRREDHPGRRVDRDSIYARTIPNYDPYEEEREQESPSEPDYEAIIERRQERHRPDWA